MPFDAAILVNDFTTSEAAQTLGEGLRHARLATGLTQQQVADRAAIDLATVRVLERGGGTMGPLLGAFDVLGARFHDQPPEAPLPEWIAACRKARGWSQEALAARLGISKPTIIQIERGKGQVRSLVAVMSSLGLRTEVVANDAPHEVQLHHGDCLEVMPGLADRSIHAIIADLPYSMTALKWDRAIPLEPLWEQFRRLLTPTGVVVLTASQPFTSALVMSNPEWFKYALVWEKSRATGFLQATKRHLRKHEDILVFSPGTVVSGKGHQTARNMTYNPQGLVELETPVRSPNGNMEGRSLSYAGGYNRLSPHFRPCYRQPNAKLSGEPSLFNGRPIRGDGRNQTHTNYPTSILRFASENKPLHPTQKPLDLMRYLVRTFSNEGDIVMDCCFGSGTTGVAALMEGRRFVGIEQDAGYFEMAKQRIMPRSEAAQG